MKPILKPLFEILTGEVAIFDNVIYNYLVLLIVGEIAYRVAWNLVGDLYRCDVISGRSSGSIIHWIIRLFTYIVTAYTIRFFIWLAAVITSIPIWVWVAIPITSTAIVVVVCIVRRKGANDQK